MRYESKHSYLKQATAVTKNFVNIPKSLAQHHQRQMCYRMANPLTFLVMIPTCGTGTVIKTIQLQYMPFKVVLNQLRAAAQNLLQPIHLIGYFELLT